MFVSHSRCPLIIRVTAISYKEWTIETFRTVVKHNKCFVVFIQETKMESSEYEETTIEEIWNCLVNSIITICQRWIFKKQVECLNISCHFLRLKKIWNQCGLNYGEDEEIIIFIIFFIICQCQRNNIKSEEAKQHSWSM